MRVITAVFAVAISWGAALLFMCQPMLAKLILPSYGGSPSVWATATFLFQFLLLLGYGVAHIAVSALGRRQVPVQLVLVLLPLLALPLALPEDAAPGAEVHPVWWLIRSLMLAVGLPFVVLAMTGPVLQLWFSWTGVQTGQDPYVLYAASNAGSLAGLLLYPFLVEWTMPLSAQAIWWSYGYLAYVVLMALCGLAVLGSRRRSRLSQPARSSNQKGANEHPEERPEPIGARRRIRWLFWAFLPAGVSLGVTTHLTTDVAAIPLLWVLPLTAYLLSFIVAFGRRSRAVPIWPGLVASALALTSLLLALPALQAPIIVDLLVGLGLVLATGMAGHSRLAADRPSVERLTGFYLVISTGGLLGGLLNGVVAPLLFPGPWEYALQLALVPLLAAGLSLPSPRPVLLHRLGTAGWVLEVLLLVAVGAGLSMLRPAAGWATLVIVLVGLVAAVIGLVASVAPRVTVVAACGLLACLAAWPLLEEQWAWRDRTFFGSYRVEASQGLHVLIHGTTIHGTQQWPGGRADLTPTTYYSETGPLGDIMANANDGPRSLALIGLGVGTALSYVGADDHADVIEIDQAIVDVASEKRWFTYLDNVRTQVRVYVGDGRLVLEDELRDGRYDILVADAFSSDAIPVHLLTREALALYLDRLRDGGVLAVHVSNRHLDLVPMVAALADDAGVPAASRSDSSPQEGAVGSTWIALSRQSAPIDSLVSTGWTRMTDIGSAPWTDDFSSIVSVLR